MNTRLNTSAFALVGGFQGALLSWFYNRFVGPT